MARKAVGRGVARAALNDRLAFTERQFLQEVPRLPSCRWASWPRACRQLQPSLQAKARRCAPSAGSSDWMEALRVLMRAGACAHLEAQRSGSGRSAASVYGHGGLQGHP